jgi:hypothetical protein
MNGRPEKLEDVCIIIYIYKSICYGDDPSRSNIFFSLSNRILQVCYSHWVLSSMAILNKLTWIDSAALTRFILSAQVRERDGCSSFRFVVFFFGFGKMKYDLPFRTPRVEESRTGRVTWRTCFTHCSALPAFLCLDTLDWKTSTLFIVCRRVLSNAWDLRRAGRHCRGARYDQ